MNTLLKTLDKEGLRRFHDLQVEAVNQVTERFYTTEGALYERFGERGREFCREDLAFHLEFLRPVLEFGLLQPMVDYLCWLDSVLAARNIPTRHLALSLDWLGEFFHQHMEGSDGVIVTAALAEARARFVATSTQQLKPPASPAPWPDSQTFEAALLAGKQREALAIVNRHLDMGHNLAEVELHIIQPALYQIGEKWQQNQVSVAQEHLASAIVHAVMSIGLVRSTPPLPINKRVLLACVAGNNHAIGLRMVADAFLLAGWEVEYLGADVPTASIVSQCATWKPDLVGLSVSFAQQLPAVRAVISGLKECLGHERPPVMLGGLAINRFSQLADKVGANGYGADAQKAVVYANKITKNKDCE
jgi:methanogenic corrinoid protein MtbC1